MKITPEEKIELTIIVCLLWVGALLLELNETNERKLPRDRLYDDGPFAEHLPAGDIYKAGR